MLEVDVFWSDFTASSPPGGKDSSSSAYESGTAEANLRTDASPILDPQLLVPTLPNGAEANSRNDWRLPTSRLLVDPAIDTLSSDTARISLLGRFPFIVEVAIVTNGATRRMVE